MARRCATNVCVCASFTFRASSTLRAPACKFKLPILLQRVARTYLYGVFFRPKMNARLAPEKKCRVREREIAGKTASSGSRENTSRVRAPCWTISKATGKIIKTVGRQPARAARKLQNKNLRQDLNELLSNTANLKLWARTNGLSRSRVKNFLFPRAAHAFFPSHYSSPNAD